MRRADGAAGRALLPLLQVQVERLHADVVAHQVLKLRGHENTLVFQRPEILTAFNCACARHVQRTVCTESMSNLQVKRFCGSSHHGLGSTGTYLSDDVLHHFVHGEGDIGVDAEELAHRVLVLRRLEVPVQQVLHHVQEVRVVLVRLHFACSRNSCVKLCVANALQRVATHSLKGARDQKQKVRAQATITCSVQLMILSCSL